ncbi:sensor histidine kinase [Nocardioides abyssi]|uniref:histidine kinase n=1 Tax=Nocardioides abyssi TaxID=3058370 RepID=A0ABT8EVY7_9ACTN|nr:histidine kinase [Nocardioides abyssi]MDN4162308.1 histidine kinase [Nocardioides abyssi]
MTTVGTPPPAWQRWVPDASAAVAALALGVLEVRSVLPDEHAAAYVVVLAVAAGVGLSRALPAAALGAAWFAGAVQVTAGVGAMTVEVLLAVVAFGCARWGSAVTVWLSGLSMPLGALIAVLWLDSNLVYRALDLIGVRLLAQTAYRGGDWRIPASLLIFALLATPWLLGLALRFLDRARRSRDSQVVAEAERDQAEEIARLREDQARLARDVHDVVGHSLAVILAQAESAQYLPEADTEALRRTMANIATSARTSLQDVRQVLSSPDGRPAASGQHGDLDALVEGVRASGHEVVSTEVGAPRPLPPELEVVAFRVLQEMLTNAIRHGRRDEPVLVERHWEGELRLEVRNVVGDQAGPGAPDGARDLETRPLASVDLAELRAQATAGHGLEGMRRRLEAVGGRLDVRRREEPGGATFTATAWVPLRAVR